MKDRYKGVFGDVEKILVVFAHPGDMEIICGGTVARLIKDGKSVMSVIMSDGQRGMHGQDFTIANFKKIRISSQMSGGEELGLHKKMNLNLEIPDGEVENDFETIGRIVEVIREFKPDIVLTHKPYEIVNHFSEEIQWINHRDHRHTASATFDAIYPYAIDHGFYPEQIRDGKKGWKVKKILTSDSYMDENYVDFDITDFVEKKRAALKQHTDGDVLTDEYVEDLVEECRVGNRYFERMGYIEL